jgi:hypothetical protein
MIDDAPKGQSGNGTSALVQRIVHESPRGTNEKMHNKLGRFADHRGWLAWLPLSLRIA